MTSRGEYDTIDCVSPTLILLNGAPATGKSTLARRYADAHPLTLNLDIDTVRGLLGDWLSDPGGAGLLARDMAVAMARIALGHGHDVVVPQLLARPEFVHRLDDLAREAGVPFAEFVLVAPPGEAEDRLVRRHEADPAHATHADNRALLERSGGLAQVATYATKIEQLVADRPHTHTITTREGEVDAAYQELLAHLAATATS